MLLSMLTIIGIDGSSLHDNVLLRELGFLPVRRSTAQPCSFAPGSRHSCRVGLRRYGATTGTTVLGDFGGVRQIYSRGRRSLNAQSRRPK